MKKTLRLLLPALLLFLCQSCTDEDDFLQEGTLRVTFGMKSNITAKTPITVEVMDFADNLVNAKPVVTHNSVGKRPVEIQLNVGNYIVRTNMGSDIEIEGVQIRKGKTTELKY